MLILFLLPATVICYGLDISLTLFFLKGTGTFFLSIVFVVELIAFQDVQTKLRLLKFAERVYTPRRLLVREFRRFSE